MGAGMGEAGDWIERRLAAALKAASTGDHVFPEAVTVEFRKLLNGPLQEPRKNADLDEMATALALANRAAK